MKIKPLLEVEFNKKLKLYIKNQLLPLLREWGLDMKAATRENSTQYNLVGFFKNSRIYVGLNFSMTSKFIEDGQGDLFCTVVIGGRSAKVGTLTCTDPDTDFEMISVAIEEDLGYDYENKEGIGLRGAV